jgi:hypothetical protein
MPSASRVAVWKGSYEFGRDTVFFPRLVQICRRYADNEPNKRPSEASFFDELRGLRDIAPYEASGLLDQIEHRWEHPHCPPALYVVTCTLRVPEGSRFVADSSGVASELPCAKLGQAKRTIAPRIARYTRDVLGGIEVVEGSQVLRVIVFGDGDAMLLERDLKRIAHGVSAQAMVSDASGRRRSVGDETYVGHDIVDALAAYAESRSAS